MYPLNDSVCVLLETPFSRFKEEGRRQLLESERPMPSLSVMKTVHSNKKTFNRKFKAVWYEQYQWLCGSYYLEKLFCWPCVLINNKHSIWNKIGFNDFLNVSRALHKHEASSEHLKCALTFKQLKKNAVSGASHENHKLQILKYNENVRLNRRFMELPIDAVLYLSKQERGICSKESFEELLKIFVKRSPVDIQNHYTKIKSIFSGGSTNVQNDLIKCISGYIEGHIVKEINEASFISVQLDNTSNLVQKPQISLIVRYVNPSSSLVERFLGFYDISEDCTSEELFNLVHCALDRHGYKSKLVAQCYDGAISDLNNFQAKIKDAAPQAVFVHSLAHNLNVILQQSVSKISQCRIFFANIAGLQDFFHRSAKRISVADSMIKRRISTTTDTDWASNSKTLGWVMMEWNGLKEIFQTVIDDSASDPKSVRQAEGFLSKFSEFEFIFLVTVFHECFELTNILSGVLQIKSLDTQYCLKQIKTVHAKIQSKRNKTECRRIFDKAMSKTRFALTDHDIFEKCKNIFYEILDIILMQIDMRSKDMEKMIFVSLADVSKFDKYSQEFPTEDLQYLKENYADEFNDTTIHRLKNELEIIYSDQQFRDMNLHELIKLLHENKEIFKETYKLFCLILTIPSTSTVSDNDKHFSCLERMKTYLRNSVSEEANSSLGRISIEKEFLGCLTAHQPFYDDIVDRYAVLKNNKLELIYKK